MGFIFFKKATVHVVGNPIFQSRSHDNAGLACSNYLLDFLNQSEQCCLEEFVALDNRTDSECCR